MRAEYLKHRSVENRAPDSNLGSITGRASFKLHKSRADYLDSHTALNDSYSIFKVERMYPFSWNRKRPNHYTTETMQHD